MHVLKFLQILLFYGITKALNEILGVLNNAFQFRTRQRIALLPKPTGGRGQLESCSVLSIFVLIFSLSVSLSSIRSGYVKETHLPFDSFLL